MAGKKPEGVVETENLLRVLVRVPKQQLEARLEKRKAKKHGKQPKK